MTFRDEYFSSLLRLSAYALSNINTVNAYCQLQEDTSTFWIPTGYDKPSRIEWFDWFGHLSFDTQKALRLDVADNLEYLQKNYVSGVEEDDEDEFVAFDASQVNLQAIDLAYLGRETAFTFTDDIEALADRLKQGAQKRHAKTLLHDRIIRDLAETFISQGAKVESDPNSVDLFAAWPSGHAAIFEVKTVTRRSLQNRLRTAVGQIEEYAYRRTISGFEIVDKVVVINTELTSSSWQTSFLTEYMGIGLICKSARSYDAFAPASSMTKEYWAA